MDVIGALKKSNSDTTIYFCGYNEADFQWKQVVKLLQSCHLMQDLDEENIYCIAVESRDNMEDDKRLVGMTFKDGNNYISLVSEDYDDLDFYLKELTGGGEN